MTEPPTAMVEADAATTWRSRAWRPLQGLGYLAFAIAGVPLTGMAQRGSWIEGVLELVVFLLIVGSVGYGISRLRGRTRGWHHVAFGRTAVVVTLALVMLSYIGQHNTA